MSKIWRNRILAEDKTFDECPKKYKAQVLALLRIDVENNIITAEEFENLTGEPYAE